MKYELRDYQKRASDAAVMAFTSKTLMDGLLILPTGAGKSLVIADIASRLDGHLLVFQPRSKLNTPPLLTALVEKYNMVARLKILHDLLTLALLLHRHREVFRVFQLTRHLNAEREVMANASHIVVYAGGNVLVGGLPHQ